MPIAEIQKELFSLQDEQYRVFQGKLIPTVAPEQFIGVRTPELRRYARQLSDSETARAFLRDLPHRYFDENQLHAFLIADIRDYTRCMDEVCRFLPYVDNWATCDQLSPKSFKKHRAELLEAITLWLNSDHTYTVRFGIGMLMTHFLDEDFDRRYPVMVSRIRSDEYYINMMIAWYFATALAKQYDAVLPLIEGKQLPSWTHNKAIQKSLESNRISDERKACLKTLRQPRRSTDN